MKIGFLGSDKSHNTGDNVILEGCREVLREAVGDFEEIFIDLPFAESLWDTSEGRDYLWSFTDPDILVIPGTPWIWDTWETSKKHRILRFLIQEVFSAKPKIGLGLGASFPLDTLTLEHHMFAPEKSGTFEEIDNIFGAFDYVTARDIYAHLLLKFSMVPVDDRVCPAAFLKVEPRKDALRPILVYHAATHGSSACSLSPLWSSDYQNYQLKFIEKYDPKIITADSLDKDILREQGGIQDAIWIKSVPELLKVLETASFVLSGRVHFAIPAQLMGIQTYIMPTDTRFLTASALGVEPVWTWGNDNPIFDMSRLHAEVPREKIEVDKNAIVKHLKEVLL